ncbi:helix-turn-helix domain-containing protein [Anaeromyxobacter oryzae]|uniref:HTH cro/C1-type domain-containing protein n=1 Tax=Anaeromyxobacter oryzae TaxID=2918170 RepID=A0ABN6N0N4_9BACT|nr:helix-turn-helix transcriptional regulator [Anaeromyxobacter oryzae]BDG06728.1 hypothetical protein AMOR_57240 [Anaeromyxobacter oryzae]
MKRLADQTLYEILEVPPDASPAAIAAAVDRAQALYGPGSLATYTLMSSDEAELLGRRIEEARATLLDPAARRRYDDDLTRNRGEVRAAANGATAQPPWGELPPVIPARKPLPDEDDVDEEDEGEGEGEEEIAAEAAVPEPPPPAAAPPPAEPAPAPAPVRPILLSREVMAPAATPAPVVPPAVVPPAAAPPAAAAQPVAAQPVAAPAPAAPTSTPVPMVPPPAPPAPPVPADATAWTGEVLRQLREARGITLQQLSERTKVTRHHIENIESDRYSALPAPVYLRGILLSLARELRLDGQKVARSYLERFAAGTAVQGSPPKPR